MKTFVFLYPITPYIDQMHHHEWCPPNECLVRRLNRIIYKRYRERGFSIVWVLFSQVLDKTEPDVSLVCQDIQIEPSDLIVPCGISFVWHCATKQYPDLDELFARLPSTMSPLYVGGFHQWDCVDKFAAYAHRQRIRTYVDEDVTDNFFLQSQCMGPVPLRRTRADYARRFSRFIKDGVWWPIHKGVQESRKDKPWFVQL